MALLLIKYSESITCNDRVLNLKEFLSTQFIKAKFKGLIRKKL